MIFLNNNVRWSWGIFPLAAALLVACGGGGSGTPAQTAQTITFGAAPSLIAGGSGTVSATGGASGNAVTFSSSTTSVCTVTGSSVTALTAGTCSITANQLGNTSYLAATAATQNITVRPSALGKAVDGYIQYAKAILDENDDGVCGTTEATVLTGATGSYSFPGKGEHLVCIVATADSVDVGTGKAFTGQLLTAPGATVATPLTTLVMNRAITAGWPTASFDISAASTTLMSQLGLSGVSLMATDPVTASSDTLLKKGMAVQSLVDGIAGASTLTSAQASQKLSSYLATLSAQSTVVMNSTFVSNYVSAVNQTTTYVSTDDVAALSAAVTGSLSGKTNIYLTTGTQDAPTALDGSVNSGKNNYIAAVATDSTFITISNCSANDTITLAGTSFPDAAVTIASTSADVRIIRNSTKVVSILLKNIIPSGNSTLIEDIATFNALGKCQISASN